MFLGLSKSKPAWSQDKVYLDFCNINWPGVFLLPLDGMLIHHRIIWASIKFTSTHLYTWKERGTLYCVSNKIALPKNTSYYMASSVSGQDGATGCFPFCHRFRKFQLEFKRKDSFWFLLTRIFGITSGGGPYISVGIFRPKFAIPFLTNRFFALIREFRKIIKNDKTDIPICWLGLIGACRSIFLGYFHWSLSSRFGIMASTLKGSPCPTMDQKVCLNLVR